MANLLFPGLIDILKKRVRLWRLGNAEIGDEKSPKGPEKDLEQVTYKSLRLEDTEMNKKEIQIECKSKKTNCQTLIMDLVS